MAKAVSIEKGFQSVTFLPDRTPEMSDRQAGSAFAQLAEYRDGAIFIAHYAGVSQWERHPDDEIVMVIEGQTILFTLEEGQDIPHELNAGEFLVVPKGIWHRFETPEAVKVMSVTPQPTDHSLERPAE